MGFRLEGLAAFAIGLALFSASGGNWLLLTPLLLASDVSAVGSPARGLAHPPTTWLTTGRPGS